MTSMRDYLGITLVLIALLGGAAVAVGAAQLTPASSTLATTTPATTTAPLTLDLAMGNREAGRLAFRATCQECHTQGRQSFTLAARERPALLQARIREGAGEMPAFPSDRLPDDTLSHILTYIGLPAEPEPKPSPEPRVRGVNFEVLEASGRPGAPATVRFRIRDDAGATIAPRDLAAFNLTVGGPTAGYRWAQREDARAAESLPDGSARYTFRAPLPADATGTFAIATEGYLQHPASTPGGAPVRDTGYNVVSYFAVTDSAPVPPRPIVRTETCNGCHGTLALHGGTRRNTEFCVMCHNVNQTDVEKRTTAGGPMPPESVLFRNLIHRVHTGEDLHQLFTIYGGSPASPAPIDLTTVHPFPKDRANCAVCHEPGTFTITRALEQSSPMTAVVDGAIARQVPPVTAACIGCHDSARTLAHAASQATSAGAEACSVCHGPGKPFSVSAVHRLAAER